MTTSKNPFVDSEDLVDEGDHPLDLDDFLEGGLTPRKLVARLVRRAALKAAAVEDEGSSAVAVADAMASMIDDDGSDPPRAGSKDKDRSTPLSLPPPSSLLLENILHEFESADADVARLRAELEALSHRAAEDLEAEELAFAEAARAAAEEGARVRAEVAELEGRRRRGGAEPPSPLAPAAACLGGSAAPDVAARLGAAERAAARAREASEVVRTLAALSDLHLLLEASRNVGGGEAPRNGGGGEASTTAAAALSLLPEPLRGATAAAFGNASLPVHYQHQQQHQSGADPLSEAATMAKKCLDVAREAHAAENAAPLLPPLGANHSSSAAATAASADAEAGRTRLSAAVSGCELVCSHLEQVAVARFDAAAALRDARGMETAAEVAASLAASSSSPTADDGGGASPPSATLLPLIQRYVSTRPIFLEPGAAAATERSAALPSSSDAAASNNSNTPAASLTALAATCASVAAAFEKEAPLLVEAFGGGGKGDSDAAVAALSTLATRLFEQKVREAVERVCLYPPTASTTASAPAGAAAASSSPLRSASNASSSVVGGASAAAAAAETSSSSSSSTAAARDAARASAEACRRVYALARAIDACAASALGLAGEEGEGEGEGGEDGGEEKDDEASPSLSPIDAAAMADAVLEDSLPDQVQSELEWLRGSFAQLLASSAAPASAAAASAAASPLKSMLRQQLQATPGSRRESPPSSPVDSVIAWHSEASERVAAAAQRGRTKQGQKRQQQRRGVVVGGDAAPSPSSSEAAEAALALFAGDGRVSGGSIPLHPGSCVDQVAALVCSSLDAAATAAVAAVSSFSASASSSSPAAGAVAAPSSSSPTRQKPALAEGASPATTALPRQKQQQRGQAASADDVDAGAACARAGLGRVLLAIEQATSDLAKLRRHARSKVSPVVAGSSSAPAAVSSALARASASAAAAAERALSSTLDAHFALRLGPLLEASTPSGVYSGEDPPDPEARPRTEALAVGVSALLSVFRAQGGDDDGATKGVDGSRQNKHQFPVSLSARNATSLSLDVAERTAGLLRSRVLRRHAFSAAGGAMSWKADVARVSSALSASSPDLSDAVRGLDAAASLLMVPAEALAGLIGVKGGGGGGAAAAAAAAAASAASSKGGNRNNDALGAPWRDVRETIEARLDVRSAAAGAVSKS